MLPRIQGRIGQAEPGQGVDGKFFFEIIFSEIMRGPIGDPMGPFGPFDTEKQALTEMRKAVKTCCDTLQLKMEGATNGEYFDMKTNSIRKWDES